MELGQLLHGVRADILAAWERGILQMPAAGWNAEPARLDHLPTLFDQVANALQPSAQGSSGPRFEELASPLEPRGLGIQLSLLRETILDWIDHADVPIPSQQLRLLHRVIDRMMAETASRSSIDFEKIVRTLDRVTQSALGRTRLDSFLPVLLGLLQESYPSIDSLTMLVQRADGLGGYRVDRGQKAPYQQAAPAVEGFASQVVSKEQPLELRAADSLPDGLRRELEQVGARVIFGIPLFQNHRVCGVLTLASRTATAFSPEEKLLLRALASRLAGVLARLRTSETSRQNEELFQSLFDGANAVIYVKDAQGRHLRVNRRFEAFFHRTQTELLGRTDYELFPREVADALAADDQLVLTSGKPLQREEEVPSDDGVHTYLTLKFPLHDADGVPFGLAGISTDISERKRAEAERMELLARERRARDEAEHAQALLNTFLNSSPIGFAFLDRELRYVRMNPAVAALHGVPPEEHVGRTVREVLPPAAADHIEAKLRQVLETGVPVAGSGIRLQKPPGSGNFVDVLGSFYPVRSTSGELLGIGVALTDISERVQLLEQVQTARTEAERSLALLDAVFASAPIGFAFVDRDLRFLRINQALADWHGIPASAPVGRTLREVIPARADEAEAIARRVLETGEPLVEREVSFTVPSAPNQVRHWMLNYFPVRMPDGRIIGVGDAVLDITARKEAEAEREHFLALLKAVLDQMPGGVLIAEAGSGRLMLANQAFERMTEITPGKADLAVAPEEVLRRFQRTDGSPYPAEEYPLVRALNRGEVVLGESFRYHSRTGVRLLTANATPVVDAQGQRLAAVLVLSDVTEQREAEARAAFLVRATEMLSSSLDYQTTLTKVAELAVPQIADWCLVHVWDKEQAHCVAMSHRDPEKLRRARQVLEQNATATDAPEPLTEVLLTGTPRFDPQPSGPERVALAPDDGRLALLRSLDAESTLLLPLMARGQTLGVIIFAMSESGRRFGPEDRALAEELVRRAALAVDNALLYKKAQEAVRIREDFLSMASHDLRSPMAGLVLQMHLLKHDLETSTGELPRAGLLRSVHAMDRQLTRISSMLETLLDISRIHAGKLSLELEVVDLVEVAHEVIDRLTETLQKAGCTWNLTAKQPVVGHWDRLRLEQVITNLVSNAAKYGAGRPVELSVWSEGDHGCLRVRDHGIGISPDHQRKLFQRFERVGDKAAFSGTGLGLWITRSIVQAMSGTIEVESCPGQGATFTVSLPKAGPLSPVGEMAKA